jgi:hypothetical protein
MPGGPNANNAAATATTAVGKARTVAISAPRVPPASNHQLTKINVAAPTPTAHARAMRPRPHPMNRHHPPQLPCIARYRQTSITALLAADGAARQA